MAVLEQKSLTRAAKQLGSPSRVSELIRGLEESLGVRIKSQGTNLLVEGNDRGTEVVGQVFSIEIVPELAREAQERLSSIGYHNVRTGRGTDTGAGPRRPPSTGSSSPPPPTTSPSRWSTSSPSGAAW